MVYFSFSWVGQMLSWLSVSIFKLILINELFALLSASGHVLHVFTWSRAPGMLLWDGNGGHMFGRSTTFQIDVSQQLLDGSLRNPVQTFMVPRWCLWMALLENGCLMWLETRLAREVNLNENSHIVGHKQWAQRRVTPFQWRRESVAKVLIR